MSVDVQAVTDKKTPRIRAKKSAQPKRRAKPKVVEKVKRNPAPVRRRPRLSGRKRAREESSSSSEEESDEDEDSDSSGSDLIILNPPPSKKRRIENAPSGTSETNESNQSQNHKKVAEKSAPKPVPIKTPVKNAKPRVPRSRKRKHKQSPPSSRKRRKQSNEPAKNEPPPLVIQPPPPPPPQNNQFSRTLADDEDYCDLCSVVVKFSDFEEHIKQHETPKKKRRKSRFGPPVKQNPRVAPISPSNFGGFTVPRPISRPIPSLESNFRSPFHHARPSRFGFQNQVQNPFAQSNPQFLQQAMDQLQQLRFQQQQQQQQFMRNQPHAMMFRGPRGNFHPNSFFAPPPKPVLEEDWECPTCTYRNMTNPKSCDMCTRSRFLTKEEEEKLESRRKEHDVRMSVVIEEQFQSTKQRKHSFETGKKFALEFFEANFDEVDIPFVRVPIFDKYSQALIELPTRSEKCTHIDIFDLRQLLINRYSFYAEERRTKESRSKMKHELCCPVCETPFCLEDMYVDEYFEWILSKVRDSNRICFAVIVTRKGEVVIDDVDADNFRSKSFEDTLQLVPEKRKTEILFLSDLSKEREIVDLTIIPSDDEDDGSRHIKEEKE